MTAWEVFVISHGFGVRADLLAAIVGRSEVEIETLRRTGACARRDSGEGRGFAELFALWHGRPPHDDDWPIPRRIGKRDVYEWHGPELALLASLVGRLGVPDIARTLTARLRQLTSDASAVRSNTAVQVRINQIGLQASDVLGGITTTEAGRDIGSLAIIQHAIRMRQLKVRRVGRLQVIDHAVWEAWKASRVTIPDSYVPLRSIRDSLGIASDKLSEFARGGFVPSAIQSSPVSAKDGSTAFGIWYIDGKVAQQLVSDRHAGRPMPWHGQPNADNLKTTYRLWKERQHPEQCETCRDIWGEGGAPLSFQDYTQRYPPIAHGAKRHMTRPWNPGLSIEDVVKDATRSRSHVMRAIQNGVLRARQQGARYFLSRTDVTRWKARKCPTGDSEKSWISLATAERYYGFSASVMDGYIAEGRIHSKIGEAGPLRGVVCVPRQQCAELRAEIGYTLDEAAARVGVPLARMRFLLDGVDWRGADRIPLVTVQACIKRNLSHCGYTIAEAAAEVGESSQWVRDRIADGTVRVLRARWDRQRLYLSAPMVKRLHEASAVPVQKEKWSRYWLLVNEAALLAGVSSGTLTTWGNTGEVARQYSSRGWRYHSSSIRKQARAYWSTVRFKRATPPAWLASRNEPQAVSP